MITNKTINDLIKYFEAKENRTEEENSFIEELSLCKDLFPITAVSRDDLASRGFSASTMTDEQMDRLARMMSDDYCEQLFWDSMEIIAEDVIGIDKVEIPMVNVDVEWDGDELDNELPNVVEVPADLDEEDVADWISDKYGWCVSSWSFV